MAAKGQEKLPTNGSYDSKYQQIIGRLFSACNDCNECSECTGELEPDLCYSIFRVMDRQTVEWWEEKIAEMKLKEGPGERSKPQKGRVPPKPKRPIVEELWITCPNCKIQETIILVDGELESTVKFAQLKSGEVWHLCLNDIACQAKLPNGKTVGEHLRKKKEG